MEYIEQIEDIRLRDNIENYVKFNWDKFITYPASTKFHHAYSGGLLDHVIEVLDIGLGIIEDNQFDVNKDYYIAGAIIHDMGKLVRYRWDDRTKTWEYAQKMDEYNINAGRVDHALYPLLDYPKVTGEALPEGVAMLVLSHMGGYSRSSVYPDTLIESILASADMISSRL